MKVTNGKDVARLLVDEYLNCHPTGHKKFMESMAKEQQEIKDNYTYLGFAWLKGLSEVRYYDLRNEASKLMADDLCLILIFLCSKTKNFFPVPFHISHMLCTASTRLLMIIFIFPLFL